MRIAFFTNSYLPVVSGVVRSVHSFRQALTDLGHNVFIFTHEADFEDEQPFIFRYPSLPLPLLGDMPATIPVSPFIDQVLPVLKPQVIHAHHPVLLGQTAANKAEELGLPLVFTFHSHYSEYTQYFPLSQNVVQRLLKEMVAEWLRDFMRKCQHIVIPSLSMRDILVQELGLENCYTVIPTGIDMQPFRLADGQALRARLGWQHNQVIVSVGRLAPEKNWPLLFYAFAQVCASHPDLRLVLIGDGPERKKLQSLADELGIAGQVIFTGKLPLQDVPAYLKAADIFGFTSLVEAQGLVTLEALAAGLPVAAVDAIGTRDVVEHDKQGLLVEANPQALAAAFARLLDAPELRQRFRAAALETAQEYEIHRQADRLLGVYQQAIETRRAGHFVEIAEMD